MRDRIPRLSACSCLLVFVATFPPLAVADDKAKDETSSEKIRKALDQPIDIEIKETSFAKIIERFHEKTKLDISIDRSGSLMGIGFPVDPNAEMPQPVEAKFKGTKVRDALRKVFEPYSLAPFIVDDQVLLASEDVGISKQLKQRVDVDVSDVPLAEAVKQLGRRKAVNLVVDQKAARQADKKVSLQVEDVALETAVRLLAEQAGMKAARIDNVLYVTTPEQAASIAADNRANQPAVPYWPYGPYGTAIGLPGGGLVGALGAFGVAGGGGVLGGLGGITGVPGIIGSPPRLPPPVPKEESKPAPPAGGSKPTGRAAPRAPAVAADDRAAVPPLSGPRSELWATEAGRSSVGARRTRRRASV